jgi:chromosome partitioning protein
LHVIVVSTKKGGSAKTTLTAHLAVEADLCDDGPVTMIDADPMAGLTAWYDARKDEMPPCIDPHALADHGIAAVLASIRESDTKFVIIDTPPSASKGVGKIIELADLVVVPVIPSPNDLRAVGETLDLIEAADKPALFVLTNAATNAKLTNQALTILSQHGTIAAVDSKPVIIHTRTDYRTAMVDGRTAREIKPKSKAAEEIAALWTAIKQRLEKEERRRGRSTATA